MVEFSPAEISAEEEFKTEIDIRDKSEKAEERLEWNDKIDLERKIEIAIEEFDAKVRSSKDSFNSNSSIFIHG